MMIGSKSSIFLERNLLHSQIIEHCSMLDEDIRKGEGGVNHMRTKGRGRKNRYFQRDPVWTTPYFMSIQCVL